MSRPAPHGTQPATTGRRFLPRWRTGPHYVAVGAFRVLTGGTLRTLEWRKTIDERLNYIEGQLLDIDRSRRD